MVHHRLIQHFLIQDLDFLACFHYAPHDSKSHPVERVMSSLNEAVGDVCFIKPCVSNVHEVIPEEILNMQSDEISAADEKLQHQAANECAEKFAAIYEGACCLGTSIHACAAGSDSPYSKINFSVMKNLQKSGTYPQQSKEELCWNPLFSVSSGHI